jgi:hypothetical protein
MQIDTTPIEERATVDCWAGYTYAFFDADHAVVQPALAKMGVIVAGGNGIDGAQVMPSLISPGNPLERIGKANAAACDIVVPHSVLLLISRCNGKREKERGKVKLILNVI